VNHKALASAEANLIDLSLREWITYAAAVPRNSAFLTPAVTVPLLLAFYTLLLGYLPS
jgi:hypothetical protein